MPPIWFTPAVTNPAVLFLPTNLGRAIAVQHLVAWDDMHRGRSVYFVNFRRPRTPHLAPMWTAPGRRAEGSARPGAKAWRRQLRVNFAPTETPPRAVRIPDAVPI